MRAHGVAVALLLLAGPLAGCFDSGEGPSPPPYPHPDPSPSPSEPSPDPDPDPDPEPEPTGPSWSLTDTDGATHSRDTAAGEPALLFFMATWCSSCRRAAAWLDDVHAEFGPRGARFYSVGQDPTERPEDLERWKAERGHPWPHGLDRDRAVQRAFGVTSQSSIVVVDAAGEVVQQWGYSRATEAEVRAALERAGSR